MNSVGIVAEYNPFHLGHSWHIAETRRQLGTDLPVVCVMSGSWVQRGECAITDKWTRAALALRGGADLILELPVFWSVASAERFARGAVETLAATGVVDTLSFGSEQGDAERLLALAGILGRADYEEALKERLEAGDSFALCRQRAVEQLAGEEYARLLEGPNDNLGVEYLRALNALDVSVRPMAIKRKGVSHDSNGTEGGFASASRIRAAALGGDWTAVGAWTPDGTADILRNAGTGDMRRIERAILAKLRTMTEEDFAALPDSAAAEGLPFRLTRAARQAVSLGEFYDLVKTRRYAHARIRRLALRAFLGLDAKKYPDHPAYLRVLGFNRRGQELLREMKEKAALPILTKGAHIKTMGEEAQRQFEIDCMATDLYRLALDKIAPGGLDLTTGPVILT